VRPSPRRSCKRKLTPLVRACLRPPVALGCWLVGDQQNAYSGNRGVGRPRRLMRWAFAALLVGWSTTTLAQLDITPPDQKGGSQKKNISNEMGALSKRLRVCLDSQAQAIAPKPVDLETVSVAVMARCGSELQQMRKFLYTGIAGFSPDPDYWSKEIEPIYLKEARKAVAVARTRDTPTAPPKPKTPPRDDRNKI
jgi:hypothetical protein